MAHVTLLAARTAAMQDDGTINAIARALVQADRPLYEALRAQLIQEKGYDTFRALQNYAFVVALYPETLT